MTGRGQNLELRRTELQHVAFARRRIDLGALRRFHTEPRRLHVEMIAQLTPDEAWLLKSMHADEFAVLTVNESTDSGSTKVVSASSGLPTRILDTASPSIRTTRS